ncbi:hypothetical protein CVT24_012980 [Panaeolus cyanescens]|uniref:Uncharacterized protein n=1 Tax=Panaeolus cyanescens TaxID=181874 RepID=A0A409XAZ4_9AGAR|nr:hypothetical protein CVT24_012980 [Panaeolus cyanescens]
MLNTEFGRFGLWEPFTWWLVDFRDARHLSLSPLSTSFQLFTQLNSTSPHPPPTFPQIYPFIYAQLTASFLCSTCTFKIQDFKGYNLAGHLHLFAVGQHLSYNILYPVNIFLLSLSLVHVAFSAICYL